MIPWSETVTIKRTAKGEYRKGLYERGEPEEIYICANIQPFDFKQLNREAQGRRVRGAIKIYTETELHSQNDCEQADKIYWRGKVYEIYQVKVYHQFGNLAHYKAIALLMNAEDQEEENSEFAVE